MTGAARLGHPGRFTQIACLTALWCAVLWSGQVSAAELELPIERVEEVVVTARRREENLEATPVSVTALSEATLREAGVQRLEDIQELVPNLQFVVGENNNGPGANVRIRGVGQVSPELTFDPGVGIYVDGVYIARTQGNLIDVLDVEQVEVLRGPQGTLFGRNAVGGAINITTAKPRDALEGFAFVRPGNFGSVRTRASVNAPLSWDGSEPRALLRTAFASSSNGGYSLNETSGDYYDDQNSLSTLSTLRVLLADDATLDVTSTWGRDHSKGRSVRCVLVGRPAIPAFQTIVDVFFPTYPSECERSKPFRFESDVAAIADVETYGAWATLNWPLAPFAGADALALKSISAWREERDRLRYDVDGTALPIIDFSNVGGQFNGSPGFGRQFSQELQLGGTALDGRAAFVAGFYGFWEEAHTSLATNIGLGIPPLEEAGTVTTDRTSAEARSAALFGQTTWRANEWLNVTGGLRWTLERKSFSRSLVNSITGSGEGFVDVDDAKTFDAVTPLFTLAADAPDTLLRGTSLDWLMGYFTYSRGFKSGGFNGIARFEPDKAAKPLKPEYLDSLELGFKTTAFERRLQLNLSLFLYFYRDIQVLSVEAVSVPGSDEPRLDAVARNAAKATAKGLELEVTSVPEDGFELTGSLGLLDARYDQFSDAQNSLTGGPIDRSGERFPNVPVAQAHLAAEYSLAVQSGAPWLRGWVTPRLDYYYQTEVFYTGPELPAATQGGYGLLNGRLSYTFAGARAQVALWVENVTDSVYFNRVISTAPLLGSVQRGYAAPRTFGAELSYFFGAI